MTNKIVGSILLFGSALLHFGSSFVPVVNHISFARKNVNLYGALNDGKNGRRAFLSSCTITTAAVLSIPKEALAEAIKTLDLDMPSYGNISSAKSSSNDVEMAELKTESPDKSSSKKSVADKGTAKKAKTESPAQPNLKKKTVAVKETAKKSNKKPTKKEKEDEEETDSKFDIVDMSLPSYGENASVDGKGGSVFSL